MLYIRIANFDPFPESFPLSFVFAFDGVNNQEVFIGINRDLKLLDGKYSLWDSLVAQMVKNLHYTSIYTLCIYM